MSDLRLGMIGFGARSSLAVHAHRPGHGSAVTVVADPSPRGKAQARERIGQDVAVVDSVQEMLAEHEVDAVMILAPDFAHAEVAAVTL
ncbi:MAG TPA: Gfo/Idh/MocA family oxidoreductase, partial [Candidatus Brachybacterium merdigallinarum]|nr:Gfo/Idh/MocA family oxidoreductase [Candidatus Brachybacterium merdigallinarum]